MLSRLSVAAAWVLHLLPLPVLALLGNALGVVIYALARRRRHIALVNLGLCFPEFDQARLRGLAIAHFKVLTRSVLERTLLWWAGRERLERLIRVEGDDRLRSLLAAGRPVLMLNGARDPFGRMAPALENALRAGGADLESDLLNAGHELSQQDIEAARAWLA